MRHFSAETSQYLGSEFESKPVLHSSRHAVELLTMEVERITETELNDLRQKFQLLEGDRKAYYEMSMHSMKENKRTITFLRDEVKKHRKQLASLQKRTSATCKQGLGGSGEETKKLARHVAMLRKNYDTVRSQIEGKRSALRELRDKALELELESQRPNEEDSPLTRKIRILENRLDKAMIKYNEAQSIRKTYEQIVKRLKEERVGFDNQLSAIERTLQAKNHDYDELLMLSGDANHAKEVALHELERVKEKLVDARKHRGRERKMKKEVVSMRSDITVRMEKREQMRQDLLAKAQGDLNTEEEKNLKRSLAVNVLNRNLVAEEAKHTREKINIYEDAFRRIKEATGVADVNEVIQKIISQEDTQSNLEELTKDNHERIEGLQEQKQKLKHRVEEIKYSGTGGGHRRKMVDDHEENLTQQTAKLERCRLKYERLAKVLINAKAGVSHLSEKLENLRQDSQPIVMNDDTVVDILIVCEDTIMSLLKQMTVDEPPAPTQAQAFISELQDSEISNSRPFNQRIALPANPSDQYYNTAKLFDANDNMELPLDEDGEEELTRERIKKASQSILQSHERRTKHKAPRKSTHNFDAIASLDSAGTSHGHNVSGRKKKAKQSIRP